MENNESVFTTPSPIIHISAEGDKVYCSTLKDSLFMLQVMPKEPWFKAVAGDPQPRLSTFHFLTNDEILVADKTGDLVGLSRDGRHLKLCG
jgi:hypothetical protein